MRRLLRLLLALLMAGMAWCAQAASLRIASGFDPQTMDPHALALLYHTRVITQVYESLVYRDEEFRIEPALAASWQALDARTWRFKLRAGVKFHDGTPLTADDVVFSIERAQDFNAKQETFTVRHANGTGPFRFERYEPDARLLLKAHPGWWGRADKRTGNLDEVSFVAIKQDATRLAALSSGEIDLVLDPPFQDVERLKKDPKLSQGTASFIEFGWTPTTDAWQSLNALFRSSDKTGAGTFNAGRYSNPQLDTVIDNIRVEPDMTRRRAMIGVALRLLRDDLPYVPLYRRTLSWAMAKKVKAVQWPNDTIELRWVRVQ